MPAIVALVTRSLIQMAVQLGLMALVEKYILPLINSAIANIMQVFGVSEDDAQDIMANEVIAFAENVAVGAVILRSKLPTKVAERLGFTSKGFSKRALSPKAAAVTAGATRAAVLETAAAVVPTATEATTILSAAKATLKGAGPAFTFLEKKLGLIFLGFIAFNNLVDFGNWNSGAYQKTFQKIFAFVSGGLLVPDEDYRKTKTTSPDVFDKVYNTYKLEGALAINDPYKMATVMFTRDNMIDLLDRVGADLLRTTQKAATKDVLLATQLSIVFPTTQPAGAPSAQTEAPAAVPAIKVFTGIVSQGTLGAPADFLARETDLIDTPDELKEAAQNNLVPWLMALPGRLIYELKIVTQVMNKDGTRRSGSAQRVISGYNKDGTPKFKTITNRFAVLDIFLLTSRNVRSKIESITLGPTDAVKLQPTREVLGILENIVKSEISTAEIGDITGIQTPNPITIAAPATSPPPAPPPPAVVIPTAPIGAQVALPGAELPKTINPSVSKYIGTLTLDNTPGRGLGYHDRTASDFTSFWTIDQAKAQFPDQFPKPATPTAAPSVATPGVVIPPSNNPNRANAQTIAEYFDVNRLVYPSVAERAKLYEAFGLGPAAWYTGTAEQNSKLLAELKRR